MQQCRVRTDLINNELKMERLDSEWEATLADKRQQVIELAKNILLQNVDRYTFEVAFGVDYDFDNDIDYELLISILADMESGTCTDMDLVVYLTTLALDGAAYCLYDIELKELYSDNYGERHMVKEVLD